jgi:hypothetical protein
MKKYLSIPVTVVLGLLIIFCNESCKKVKLVESTTN